MMLLVLGLVFIIPGQAVYADTEELKVLLQRNNCVACHAIDKRKYGPILQDVAAKYAGKPSAAQELAVKIKAGGSGVWGADMMPPQPHVSSADAERMAKLIMALK
ncbi:MAG: c-type cytochrome [Burkholderiaceae bacterium]|jgi:cytochrome c